FGRVEVAAGLPDFRSLPFDQVELRARGPFGREDDRAHFESPGGPGRRRAVVAGRGRHHTGRASFPVFLERRQRSAPLEGAELMRVFSLEEERSLRGKAGRSGFERSYEQVTSDEV